MKQVIMSSIDEHDFNFQELQVAMVGEYVSLLSKRLLCAAVMILETFGIEP